MHLARVEAQSWLCSITQPACRARGTWPHSRPNPHTRETRAKGHMSRLRSTCRLASIELQRTVLTPRN
eukprot:2657045-Prymnesium_polylepis.1